MTGEPRLDDVDRRLLHRLGEQAEPDLAALAPDVGTTEADARARYARLRAVGVVRDCAVRVEPAAVGAPVTAFLLLRVAVTAGTRDAVRRLLVDLEEVEEAHAVSGPADWLLKVRLAAPADLEALVAERLPLVPGFVRAEPVVVVETACDKANADLVRLATVAPR